MFPTFCVSSPMACLENTSFMGIL
uniref:Uncharacterized protein n=1 Tax=Arundo donax TaxID=35708 RepID=A0A0A9EE17_ARUDO